MTFVAHCRRSLTKSRPLVFRLQLWVEAVAFGQRKTTDRLGETNHSARRARCRHGDARVGIMVAWKASHAHVIGRDVGALAAYHSFNDRICDLLTSCRRPAGFRKPSNVNEWHDCGETRPRMSGE